MRQNSDKSCVYTALPLQAANGLLSEVEYIEAKVANSKKKGEEEGDEVVRQQDHNHALDHAIAELWSDVEIAFFEPSMWI